MMKPSFAKTAMSLSVLLCLAQISLADVTIRIKIKQGPEAERYLTMRFKGRRQRNESEQAGKDQPFAQVYQCDKKQMVSIVYDRKQYFVHPVSMSASASLAFNEPQFAPPVQNAQQHVRHGGQLNQTVTVSDTGERREMFGFQARHIKTTTVWEATPACKQAGPREETDGWYIDLLYGVECSPDLSGLWSQGYRAPRSKCYEQYNKKHYEFHSQQSGVARFGFPLVLTRKVYSDDGKAVINYHEVVELSTAELDQALFDAPADFVQMPIRYYRRPFFERVVSFISRR